MDTCSFYESIDQTTIDMFIASEQEENLHLDFKLINASEMTRDDRKNFAKVLSGFANSDGGIVIWGIDARQNSEGTDCACGRNEISPLSLFLSKLNEHTGQFVNPIVDGVIHKKIEVSNNSGFVVTLIPPSDSGPHMAKAGEDRYYKRSGDRFAKMEHFDIEDMFGRRSRPRLLLQYDITRGIRCQGEVMQFRIILSIENDGRASAVAPYLSIQVSGPCSMDGYGLDGNHNEGLKRLISTSGSTCYRYGGMHDLVIHPGTKYPVIALKGTFDPSQSFDHITIEYELAAEGFRLIKDTLFIEVNHLIGMIQKAWRD